MGDKKKNYIEGIGWRYDTEHSQKRRHHSHRYSDVGTYLVTLVVKDRVPVFGVVNGDIKAAATDKEYPATTLSALGGKLLHEELPKIQAIYPMVQIWNACIMPDHLHLLIRVSSPLPKGKYLGTVVGAFKGGVSRAWGQGTLFEDNYNDRILMRDGQLENWKAYLQANPFRWLVRHKHPELMQRALCMEISGVRYAAFGNFMLLRHPEKVQVFFHRKMEDDRLTPDAQGQQPQQPLLPQQPLQSSLPQQPQCQWRKPLIPTEQTDYWKRERARLIEQAKQGDVLVTPGISECEKRIKNECLQSHYRLIHIQKEPIGRYWKPERSRFEACIAGTLLILAPWQEDQRGSTDYEIFHNLNDLAASICAIDEKTAAKVLEYSKRK